MFGENQFFPTPIDLIHKMTRDIDFREVRSVLEPSAGKGNIVEVVEKKIKSNLGYYNRDKNIDIDTIELNNDLQHILKGKGYRVIHDNFLTFNTYKKYDLIIMNPPFKDGEKHLLKAIQLQEQGGKIVAIINAETLRNPYSNTRKDLIRKLEQYDTDVEYVQDAFVDAERKTGVEVALIKIDIPKITHNSVIVSTLKQEEQHREEIPYNSNQIVNADFIKGIVEQYNFEVKAGLKLIAEYKALKPLMLNSLKDDRYKSPILELKLHYEDNESTLENAYIKQIRMKYWSALFESDQFMGLFTSNLRSKYINKVRELQNYDFSLYNIYTLRIELNKELIKGVEDTIVDLFDEFSHRYHYTETSNNIHLFNGWKTNKSWKINDKKIIVPLNAYDSWTNGLEYTWRVAEKLADIEKVFDYLDDGETEHINLKETLKQAQEENKTKKIELKYYYATFYKKGTCHLEWKNKDLVHKFNLFAAKSKAWIPPAYGKKQYKDMTKEEKTVIDEFEGEKSYNKVMKNKDYYMPNTSEMLMLDTRKAV